MESKRPRIESLLDKLASLSDFTLIAGLDQEKVPVVRKLLMQNSVYFEKLLGPSFREGTQQEVTLQDIDKPTLTAIITFIYSDGIDITEECVANILDGASRMELVSLEKSCEDFLWKNLSKENCIQTFLLADKHCFDALKTTALKLVGAHFERILESDLLQLDGRVLGEILNYGQLHVPETRLFDLLVHWAEKNEKMCSQFMPNLLKSIRLEHLPGEFISNVVKPIFEQYESSALVSAEYERRMLNHQINPRRWNENSNRKNIFYAEIVDQRIDIHKFYPQSEQLASIAFPTSRIHKGWVYHGGRFYQMGGYYSAEGGRTSAEVECIDMETKRRTALPNMLNARSSFKPIVSGKHIYVFGGKNKQGPIADCERFDTERNLWEALPKMPLASRKCVGMELNGKFFVFASVSYIDNTTVKYWCEYNLATRKWSDAKNFGDNMAKMEMIVVRHDNHVINVILDSHNILSFDTKKSRFESPKSRKILLPNIEICRIKACAGSPYLFYKLSGNHKFGRIVFNGNECNIVDSVETSPTSLKGLLFKY